MPVSSRITRPGATAVTHSSDQMQPLTTEGGAKSKAAQDCPLPQAVCGPPVYAQILPGSNGRVIMVVPGCRGYEAGRPPRGRQKD
ncbi:MAG: hypothetical protein MUO64_08390 [Anaerolineales bacterium]|nr:hypothetical protein [Anaerolineales bacterium]